MHAASVHFLSFVHFCDFSKGKKSHFTGICAIFDPNCHVVDQTVYCINK